MNRPAILVTGAAHRLGAAIARRFGAEGWHVVVHYGTSATAAQALADSLPSAQAMQCDLADSTAAVSMVETLASQLTDWRGLINCASVFEPDDVTGLDPVTYQQAMLVNALAPARMAQSYLRHARASSGRRVIHVTDQKITNPNPDFFSYTMSKHALHATIAMMALCADPADRVYGLAPGAILPSHDQTAREFEISGRLNLLRRITRPDEIADCAWYLAQGWLASGETLFVDSGQHLLSQARDVLYLARQGEQS